MSDLSAALNRLHRWVVFDSRDWSATSDGAMVWAILVGWDDAFDEVATRFGWSPNYIADLKRLHAAISKHRVSGTP